MVMTLIFAVSISAIYASGHSGKTCGKGSSCKGGYGKSDLESKFYKKAWMIMENGDELGLSDEITDKIKDLKMSTKKALVMKKAEIEVIGLDIKSLLHESTVNTEEINKLIDKKYELKKEKAKSIIAAYATLKGYLSEGQMDKLKELYKESKCKFSN